MDFEREMADYAWEQEYSNYLAEQAAQEEAQLDNYYYDWMEMKQMYDRDAEVRAELDEDPREMEF